MPSVTMALPMVWRVRVSIVEGYVLPAMALIVIMVFKISSLMTQEKVKRLLIAEVANVLHALCCVEMEFSMEMKLPRIAEE
jgi:hypothetical protein